MTPLPIAILISGRGTNMRVIAERAAAGNLPVDVRVVISDRPAAEGLQTAAAMNIATRALAPRDFADRASYDQALMQLLAEYQPKLVVLAGFMRILTPHFIGAFAGRILNVHPSLLPNYRGLHTHRRVLEAGEKLHGVSVHFVTEELDGGPVIAQAEVPVMPGDSEATLSARVQRAEHRIYPQVIDWLARGRLSLQDGRVWLDGKPLDQPRREPAEVAGG
ncbi:MAG TPA: phosphoribosylglycinamide formyltransferase [Steroidobacteraceae bacterium]|jgi:phosphoribosylglycinamide formyltransferase-1|nr:phosphoribosylglycinamide formyltransferase [Steroidobacteraceae bacterium]